jgi:hypothetical protein
MRQADKAAGDDRAELTRDGAMGVQAAVAFAGVGRTKLYAMMDSGDLPYSMVNGRRLIPRRALVDLLARNLVGGSAG